MSIHDEVIAFIRSPNPARFDGLGLEVFRHQFEHVPAYRQYCMSRGCRPENVRSLVRVPPVSTVAFKYAELMSDEFTTSAAPLLFATSGTTEGRERRGRHFVPRADIYRESAIRHLRAMVFTGLERIAILALHPTADELPESSLGRMVTWAIEEFGTPSSRCFATRERVDIAATIGALKEFALRGERVCLLGTTAAFAALFDGLRAVTPALRLAPGSRMMDTGGAKGQVAPLTPDTVVALAATQLGIEPQCVVNEYGMTELCSQLYDATALNSAVSSGAGPRSKVAPAWMRPYALDPVTLAPLADGRVGLLAFFDLANVGSVSAVMTEDFGIIDDGRVRVLGRSAAGDARGCALGIEEFATVPARVDLQVTQ
jgi:hypothetical protein